ncbi:hypothetical protein os1_14100 [Comamonadaceae bacterium OS-1]|nr:hypothetical protein os1_14100 [Comamonadaceae bacterium OS-1]
MFGATRELLVREGYAWIGVSMQRNGIEAMKKWNPARYSRLSVAASNTDPADGSAVDHANPQIMAVGGDVLAWDIFSQVGRSAADGRSQMMGGLKAQKLIAAAESQSTIKVSTYYNSIQPLHRVFDGFLLYDRSGVLRTDVGTKTIAIGTEIFTLLMGQPPQDDTDHQRWWELNGASHFSLDEVQSYVDPMLVRDANGQILGGIRTAAQDAPIAANAGTGNGPWFCGPSGNHVDFTPAQLCRRYASHANYVARVQAIVNANVRSRVLLPEEAQRTVDAAKALDFSCPG